MRLWILASAGLMATGASAGAQDIAALRASCAVAAVEVQTRLSPLLSRGDAAAAWGVANAVASARLARGYCAGDRPEQGVAIYRRILDGLVVYAPAVETAMQYGDAEVPERDVLVGGEPGNEVGDR